MLRLKDLSALQLSMVMYCKGDGVPKNGDSIGYELHGPDFAVARSLERKGLGSIEGIGGSIPPMFWLNEDGLEMARERDWLDDGDDDDFEGWFGAR